MLRPRLRDQPEVVLEADVVIHAEHAPDLRDVEPEGGEGETGLGPAHDGAAPTSEGGAAPASDSRAGPASEGGAAPASDSRAAPASE